MKLDVLPDARQEPEEEKETVALGKWRQESKDTVYSQCHNKAAATAQFVCQTAPQERSNHHAQKDHQTYTDKEREKMMLLTHQIIM